VGVQEVRWDKGGTVIAGDNNFFYVKRNVNNQLGTRFFFGTPQKQESRVCY